MIALKTLHTYKYPCHFILISKAGPLVYHLTQFMINIKMIYLSAHIVTFVNELYFLHEKKQGKLERSRKHKEQIEIKLNNARKLCSKSP